MLIQQWFLTYIPNENTIYGKLTDGKGFKGASGKLLSELVSLEIDKFAVKF
jgi:hypothetical protein